MKTAILELIASRICHDLISPTSAIQNGIEFAEEMGFEDAGAEAFELIAQSVKVASSRLQVFRIAYGMGGRDVGIKPEDIHEIFGNLLAADGKTTQNWDPFSPIGFDERPEGYAKVLMSSLLLALECLPKGGEITINAISPSECEIQATGVSAFIRDNVVESLKHDIAIDDLDARTVHAYASSLLANEYGFTISMQAKEGSDDPKTVLINISH